VIRVDTQSEPVTLDLAQTAVIVVDMQNDFGAPGGMFDRAGVDISGIRAAVEPTARVLAAARRAGLKVVYLKMGFQSDLSDAGAEDSPNRRRHLAFGVGKEAPAPNGTTGRYLIRDTWNTDIVDELRPESEDIVLYKHRFSGFYETELHETLQSLGITYLIFTGCTTSVCVESTIRDAMFRDYHCVVLEDCTAEPIGAETSRTNHEASLLLFNVFFGWVAKSSEMLTALAGEPVSTNRS